MAKSEDALDQYRGRQKFGKVEKAAYARKMFEEDLLRPPKDPIKPLVLPKKPPHRRAEEQVSAAPPVARPPSTAPQTPSPSTAAFLANPVFAPWHHLLRAERVLSREQQVAQAERAPRGKEGRGPLPRL